MISRAPGSKGDGKAASGAKGRARKKKKSRGKGKNTRLSEDLTEEAAEKASVEEPTPEETPPEETPPEEASLDSGVAEEALPEESPSEEPAPEESGPDASGEEVVAESGEEAQAAGTSEEATAADPTDESADEESAPSGSPDVAPSVELSEEEEDEVPHLDGERLRACIEAILFASPEPVSRRRLYRLIPEADNAKIREALLELEGELLSTHRGYVLVEEGNGFRFLSKAEFAPYVARLRGEKRKIRLSAAAFETLAVIAYRQPARRADLEAIRGVQCGAILKNLMEWNLIRVVGHDDSPGRPLLYGTTGEFLEMLGLTALSELPEPERLRERGEDRGLQVLDRIIEEGGGLPRVAEGAVDEVAAEDSTAVEDSTGADETVAEHPSAEAEATTSEEERAPEGADFDLDLDEDEPTSD